MRLHVQLILFFKEISKTIYGYIARKVAELNATILYFICKMYESIFL